MLAYNAKFVIFIAILFNVITAIVVTSILEYRVRLRRSVVMVSSPRDWTVNFFPSFYSNRAIFCYVVTLILVSAIFMNWALPFQYMVFGLVSVFLFFYYSSRFSKNWRKYSSQLFTKKLFTTALLMRIAYVTFIYFYYIQMTGRPNAFYAGDELFYENLAEHWHEYGLESFLSILSEYVVFSDTGYCWWLGIEYNLLGAHLYLVRIVKCIIDAFSCLLIYNLAERNFGEPAGRMAALFYMLLPNAWYYCGVSLKECEMAFLTILFVERGDLVLRSQRIKIKDLFLPLFIIIIMFTFRTALGAVLFASMVAALVLTTTKQLQWWKKVLYSALFGIWMFFAVGVEIVQETQQLWVDRSENQEVGYEWRSETNTFAKYATASVFAPLIFTIPFASMVNVYGQDVQMMLNGANFIKNIMSGFTIFAMFLMLFRGDWRKHVLSLAVMSGYLVVLVFSNFAHAERFHFPILGFEYMFAAYGITQMTNRHKRWYTVWIVGVCIANVVWGLVKLRGRGWV